MASWTKRWWGVPLVIVLVSVGVLVGLIILEILLDILVPSPILLAQRIATRNTIARLETGLGNFRDDFGDYPPSDKEHMAAQPYGYQNLVFYLCGPDGTGWGGRAGGAMPFGGSNLEIFGPYFEKGGDGSGNHPAAGVSDAFRPPKPILYFRAEPTEEPMFDAADNPLDPTGREGFASREHFEMLARRADGQWVRRDYLLISAGPDRLFGYVVEDEASGDLRPARPEEKEKAFCDDVANFKY
jgi:hypothetical protein